jgi:hypothetical protein
LNEYKNFKGINVSGIKNRKICGTIVFYKSYLRLACMSAEEFASGLLGAAIGATGAVLSSIVTIRHESKKIEGERKAERKKDLQNLVGKYLSISQDTIDSLWHMLNNVYKKGGTRAMDDEYYEITTLYALARFFAVKQIMMLEGAYSYIETAYPGIAEAFLSMFTQKGSLEQELFLKLLLQEPFVKQTQGRFLKIFKRNQNKENKKLGVVERLLDLYKVKKLGLGVRLLNVFEGVDKDINDIVEDVIRDKSAPFYRYYRQQLGEAIMEREQGQWKISNLLDFEEKYFPKNNENRKLPAFLETAKKFVSVLGQTVDKINSAGASRDSVSLATEKIPPQEEQIMNSFKEIMVLLQMASDDLSIVTGLPSRIPEHERITL